MKCTHSKTYLQFDALGNVYFKVRKVDGGVSYEATGVYKFNPETRAVTRLVTETPGTVYDEYIVSKDGAWLFVNADIWDYSGAEPACNHMLQVIPVTDPEHPVTLDDINGYYSNLYYDEENSNLYFSRHGAGGSGFCSLHNENGVFDIDHMDMLTDHSEGTSEWAFLTIKGIAQTSNGFYGFVPGSADNGTRDIYTLMQIVDEHGNLCHNVVTGAENYFGIESQVENDKVIFMNDGDGDNTLILFDPQTGTFTDLFQNVPGTPVVIESYCCGDGCVYFSGTSGTNVISGKIDVETLEHTRIESAKKMTQIVAIKEDPEPVI